MRWTSGSLLAFVILGATPLLAGTASGKFTAGDDAIVPKHAAAYIVRDGFAPMNRQVELVLSERPFDAAEAAQGLDPHSIAINADALKEGNYILFWIDPDGSVSMNATFSQTMSQYGDPGSGLKAELTSNTFEKVEGRIYTPKPIKTMTGESYAVDVQFSTAVSRGAAEGAKLASGGGEPMAGLKRLLAAIEKKDLKAINASLSEKNVANLNADYNDDQENLESVTQVLSFWLPKSMKYVGGTTSGDTAVLEIEGSPSEGLKMLYLVRMAKTPSGWVLDASVPVGMIR